MKTGTERKTDDSRKVQYTQAMKSLEQLNQFFQQREDYIDMVKGENIELQEQNKELIDALTESSSK